MRRSALACAIALAILNPAGATSPSTDVAGVRLPDHINVAGRDMVLNGAGLRRILLLKIYVAALYLPQRRHDSHAILEQNMPRSLLLTLVRDLSTEQNLEALKDGLIANNTPSVLESIRPEVEQFLGYIRTLHEVPSGTVIHLDYLPGVGTRVSVRDRYLGTVAGEEFNRAILRIWLGDDPVQTSLKRALLGEG